MNPLTDYMNPSIDYIDPSFHQYNYMDNFANTLNLLSITFWLYIKKKSQSYNKKTLKKEKNFSLEFYLFNKKGEHNDKQNSYEDRIRNMCINWNISRKDAIELINNFERLQS